MSYKEAGVDVEKADLFTKKIAKLAKRTLTFHEGKILQGLGGYAGVYQQGNRFLASSTDGVGTKLNLAFELGDHKSVGIDLVAMSVNDLICVGARPLFFLDYLACGKLDASVHEDVIEGIVQGLEESECALIGGETAEMPGFYPDGHYDLAGFAVGEIEERDFYKKEDIKPGTELIGLPSKGFHSNGFSLIRTLLKEEEEALKRELLTPTRIYWPIFKRLREQDNIRSLILGACHITGGGITNLMRVNPDLGIHIEYLPSLDELPQSMKIICERLLSQGIEKKELYQTFNMGVGMVIMTDHGEDLLQVLKDLGEDAFSIGRMTDHQGLIESSFMDLKL